MDTLTNTMPLTLRLHGERDGSACDVACYTSIELRSSGCEYLRSFLDFDAATYAHQHPDDTDKLMASDESATALDVCTGSCGASLAASVLHFLICGHSEAPLEVDGSNAAELLSLADLWCVDKLKAHVLAALRKTMCNGFRRPVAGTAAVEAVPQVAVLARQALDFGIGDPDGGLQRLYNDCTTWLATWPARTWPTRTFASLQRPIQDDVLALAKGLVDMDTAPAVLSSCRQLSGIPSVAWARRIDEMRSELTNYTLTYIWNNFFNICVRAGLRRCRSECWGALLEELRSHVTENPDPNAAVRVLPRWASITRALLYGASPAAVAAALSQSRGGGGGGGGDAPWETGPSAVAAAVALTPGGSWLGEDEASQMQDLYELVRSYCVRHLPLVARCAAFRGLTPAEQQSILLIAQEGICAGLAAGAAATRTSTPSVQPSGGPTARGGSGGDRSSAAWVISLTDSQAISSPPSTSRPLGPSKPQRAVGSSRKASEVAAPSPAAAIVRTPQASRRSTEVSLRHPTRSSTAARERLVATAAAAARVSLGGPSLTAPPRISRSMKSAASVGPNTSNAVASSVPTAEFPTIGSSSARGQSGPLHTCAAGEDKRDGGGKGVAPSYRMGQGADDITRPRDAESVIGNYADLAAIATAVTEATAPAATAVENAEGGGVGDPLPAASEVDETGVAGVAGEGAANLVMMKSTAGLEEHERAALANSVVACMAMAEIEGASTAASITAAVGIPPADIAVTATAKIRFLVPPPTDADFDTLHADAAAVSCYVPLSIGSRFKNDADEASCSQQERVTGLSTEPAAMPCKPVRYSVFGAETGTGAVGTRLRIPEEEGLGSAGPREASKEQREPDVEAADALQVKLMADANDHVADRTGAQAEVVLENEAAAVPATAAEIRELLVPMAATAAELRTSSSACCVPALTSSSQEREGCGVGTSAVGGLDHESAAVLGASRAEEEEKEEAAGEVGVAENAELALGDRSEPGEAGGVAPAAPALPPPPSVSTFVGGVKSSMVPPAPSNLNAMLRGATADGGDTCTASPPSTPMQREAAGAPGNSPKAADVDDGDDVIGGHVVNGTTSTKVVEESTEGTAMAASVMHYTEASGSIESLMPRQDVVEVVYAILDSVGATATVFDGVPSADEWSHPPTNRSATDIDSPADGLDLPAAAVAAVVQVASQVAKGSGRGRPSLALANSSEAAVKGEDKSKTIVSMAAKRDTAPSSKGVATAAAVSKAHGLVRVCNTLCGDGLAHGSGSGTKLPARPWVYSRTSRSSPTIAAAATTTAAVTADPSPLAKGLNTTSRLATGAKSVTPTAASASRTVSLGSRSRTAAAAVGPRQRPAAVETPSTAAATATATSRRTAANAVSRVSGAAAAILSHKKSTAVNPSSATDRVSSTVAVGAEPEARRMEASCSAWRLKTVHATTTTPGSSNRTAPVEVRRNVAKLIRSPPPPQVPPSRANRLQLTEGVAAMAAGPKAGGVAAAAASKGNSDTKRRALPT